MTGQPFDKQSYFALALDPIHVGTGGYRLGRVDMSIVREPGTNVPKIPGTSLSGACRTYATMQHPDKWPHCAGQGQAQDEHYQGHCGDSNCPICVSFGFSKGEGSSFQGLAQFSDARLVLFPVHSLAGPVWVTCESALRMGNGECANGNCRVENDKVCVASGVMKERGRLNLGWLMLEAKSGFSLSLPNVPQEILDRAVLVSDKLFGHIINDNLEVRTSVSIDPRTGAASDGALFTYEALPRSSVLAFDVVVSDPQFYRIDGEVPLQGEKEEKREENGEEGIEKVRGTVEDGLRLFESLGVGGMNTRGMGRLKVLGLEVKEVGNE